MAQLALSSIAVTPDWSVIATWGTFDKADFLALSGGVRIQYLVNGTWQPEGDGKLIRAGLPISIPGLTDVYPPGPTGVRAKLATVGIGATLDLDLYSL